MTTATRLRAAEPGRGTAAARVLEADADTVDAVVAGLRGLASSGWAGRPAAAVLDASGALASALVGLSGSARLAADVARAAAGAVARAQELLARAEATAAVHALRVLPDGRVPWSPVEVSGVLDLAQQRERDLRRAQEHRAAEVAGALAVAALQACDEAERDAASALDAVAPPVTALDLLRRGPVLAVAAAVGGVAAIGSRALPPPGTAPLGVAAWWASQPRAAQQRAARLQGPALGALDGLPAAVRDRALRPVLEAALAGPLDPAPRAALEQVRRQLDAHPGSRLLSLDVGRALAAVVLGDPDRASSVAVLVPGLFGDTAHGLPGLLASARDLRAAAGAAAAGLAVVAWTGYATPRGPTVLWERRARQGAPLLRSALRGLDAWAAAAGRDPRLTGVGHSYGSLVVGLAAREPTGLDAVVLLGSPGAGADAAAELRVPAGRVFVAEAPWDAVADLGRFGRDPGDEAFGARALDVGGISGHTSHYAPGTPALDCLAEVVVGDERCATP